MDGRERAGKGHVMRCLTLAAALRNYGAQIAFSLGTEDHDAVHDVLRSGHRVVSDRPTDLEPLDLDWLVVDHYQLDAAWEAQMRPLARQLMVIDDLANRPHEADLLLDQGYGAHADHYRPLVNEGCRLLLGTDYTLLRPEFQSARRRRLTTAPTRAPHNMHLFFGSVDSHELTERFARVILENQPNLHISAVIGYSYPSISRLKALACRFPGRFKWQANVSSMADHIAACDVAVGAPGMTTWERACIGLPSLYFAVAQTQIAILERLHVEGFCVYAGVASEVSNDQIANSTDTFLGDVIRLRTMHERSIDAVDGKGVRRVCRAMQRESAVDLATAAVLKSGPVRLKAYLPAHDASTVEWLNDPSVREGFGYTGTTTIETHRAWVEANPQVVIFAIIGPDERHSGNVLLHLDTDETRAYLQMYVGPMDARGRGIGWHALKAALCWAFDTADIKAVRLHTLPHNDTAANLYRKAGFVFTGIERAALSNGMQRDQHAFILLAHQWIDR